MSTETTAGPADGGALTEAEREALDVMGMFPTARGFAHPVEWERESAARLFGKVARIKADAYAAGLAARGGDTAAGDGLRAAARDLLALKDGPRDSLYHERKSDYWEHLRAALDAAPARDAEDRAREGER